MAQYDGGKRAVALAQQKELSDDELLELNRTLLDAVGALDYGTYTRLCDSSLSCFEPEAKGHLVTGLDFHKYYFDLGKSAGTAPAPQVTVVAPHVRWMCGRRCAVVSYKRLIQVGSTTSATEETRVWENKSELGAGDWRLVHFHRSPGA